MSDIIINNSEPSSGLFERYYFDADCGKRSGMVSFVDDGRVEVCCKNAVHSVYRGAGRVCYGLREALDAYKSPEMKSIILACARAALEHWRGLSIHPRRHEVMLELCEILEPKEVAS